MPAGLQTRTVGSPLPGIKRQQAPVVSPIHYDHEGWYIVWRYLVDPTESIETHKPVIIWRVDVVYLNKEDWKYEKSAAGEAGGGRTHTFGVRRAGAKLKACAVYRRSDIVLSHGKPIPKNGNGENSG
jgi:hypothetical protein